MTFDPMAALAPIAKASEVPLVLFSNPEVPAKTMREFIDYARANPGKANYGIPSLGTVNHLMMERLKQTTGVEITRVPYRGSPEATLALLKNDIQLFPIGLAAVGGHFKEGRVTALAVATEQRVPMLPDVPTMAEAGFPGFVASNWWGMAAPAGTPDDILDTLAQAVAEAQKTDVVKERFTILGMLAPGTDPAAVRRRASGPRPICGVKPCSAARSRWNSRVPAGKTDGKLRPPLTPALQGVRPRQVFPPEV